MPVPVIIFVYNRPIHTVKTIEALANNTLANETDIYIYSDAPKHVDNDHDVKKVREYIDSLESRNLFKSVNVIKAKVNKGLAKSVIDGVNAVFQKYEKIIVLEDDLVTTSNFLHYMNECLEFYSEKKDIWSISGYSYNLKIPNDYKETVYLSYRASSWGWGTWKNRWEKVDWDVKDYDVFRKNKQMQKTLNKGGRDMTDMLHLQMQGKIDSWAIRWCYSQSKLEMKTVYPVNSKVRNIGIDGTGTHSGVAPKFDVLFGEQETDFHLKDLNVDKRIIKSFRNFYMSKTRYYLSQCKKIFKKIMRID